MHLTDTKKGQIVRALLDKDTYQVGLQFELDKYYKDSRAVKNAVYRAYQAAVKDPARYGLTIEDAAKIQDTMKSRLPVQIRANLPTTLREKMDDEKNKDFKELAIEGRNKAYQILLRKLDMVGRNKRNLGEVNLSTLATTFGILFDKAQITKGEATENVAIMGKVDTNMSAEDALGMVLKMREINQIDKEAKKK